MKKKVTKVKVLVAVLAIVLVGTLIAGIALTRKREGQVKLEAELARTMSYNKVQDGEEKVQVDEKDFDYVQFDAFFLRDLNGDGYAEGVRGTCKEIGKEDTLYMNLNVLTNGYLENGKITINSDNFYFQTAIVKDGEVKNNYISNNTSVIEFNNINNGTQKLLTGTVRSGDYTYSSRKTDAIGNDTSKYSKINSVTLTGTHVAADGTRTQIEKTVNFNVDWYGTVEAEFPTYIESVNYKNQEKDIENIIDKENNEINLEFEVAIRETKKQLNIAKSVLQGNIPDLNGYNPTKVEITGTNVTYTWNSDTGEFSAERKAEKNEDGIITTPGYSEEYNLYKINKYKIRVTYPIEAYKYLGADTIEYNIPVRAYYEGYNNPHTEDMFENPFISKIINDTIHITFKKPEGNVAIFKVNVGKHVYEPSERYIVSKKGALDIYNGISEEDNDTYVVTWEGSTGIQGNSTGMIMKETKNESTQVSDQFIKKDNNIESMENVTTNIGIYFANPVSLLGEDGEIRVYDDVTGELIETFTKDNWSKYDSKNPYKYKYPVKHIRIETSNTNALASLYVYNIKELDNTYITEHYDRQNFSDFKYIKSTLTGYIDQNYINTDNQTASYEEPVSVVDFTIKPNAMSTQETQKETVITIRTIADENYNEEEWSNGAFLLKLPKEILNAQINNINISNQNVSIVSSEIYKNGENIFIKVLTQNDNTANYYIIINLDITPDPRISTILSTVELYATNDNCENYYYPEEDIYDINENSNLQEKVSKTTATINLVSPNSLLTNEIATNYDLSGSEAIAPQIAEVSKEQRTATVNVNIHNNYTSTISDVKILGRIPFEGNKYTINNTPMGSSFTATMSDKGIILPEDLKNIATVYYSTNGNATEEINEKENNWTQYPNNFEEVRSYLIDLGSYKLEKNEEHVITYDINIPEKINYNEISYSHHAVYFSLDTTEGKYKTQTEPNKLGFMVAKKYTLELTKYQKNSTKRVSGATYLIKEKDKEEGKARVTDANGVLKIEGLYIDKVYIIKEIKSPDEYELNTDQIEFIAHEENGQIKVTRNSGIIKEIKEVQPDGDNGYKIQISLEDEVKANLKIIKQSKENQEKLKNIKFKIKGYGLPESGRILTTDASGEIALKGLKIGETYTVEETRAEGYYLESPIKFVINSNDGQYTATIKEGNYLEKQIVFENDIPTLNLKLENEKIPTFNLEITKVAKGENTPLKNAKFELFCKDNSSKKYYTTDEEGKIQIPNLFQYKKDKNIMAEYVLKEIITPDGYTTCKDIEFKVQEKDGKLTLELINGELKETTAEGNEIKIIVEDAPIFKLVKKDSNTDALIPNAKFAIYNFGGDKETFATDINGKILGEQKQYDRIEFENLTDYPWEMDANGVWQSTNYNIGSSASIMKIKEFEIKEEGTLKFEWSVSSEAPNYDYLYCKITDLASGDEINYEKIEGLQYGDTYENLRYIHNEIKLSPGRYSVEFGYKKDIQTNEGLDKGFIKNIDIDIPIYDNYYLIKTNENGELEAKLKPGLYKAVEIESNEEYELNKYIEERTYYFGIDEEMEEINGINLSATILNENRADYKAYPKSITKTNDGGYAICGDFTKELKISNDITYVNDSVKYDSFIIKYSSEGEVEWSKYISGNNNENLNYIIESNDDGIVVCGGSDSKEINISDEKIIQYNGKDYTGFVIKYSKNGELQWVNNYEKTLIQSSAGGGASTGASFNEINGIKQKKDGNYIAFINYGSSGEGYKIKFSNSIEIESNGFKDSALVEYDSNGNVLWAKGIGSEKYDYDIRFAMTDDGYLVYFNWGGEKLKLTNDEVIESDNEDRKNILIKYNFRNEIEWYKQLNYKIQEIVPTNDGGYILNGSFKGTMNIDDRITLENDTNTSYVIKYDRTNTAVWAQKTDEQLNRCKIFENDDKYIIINTKKIIQLDCNTGNITKQTEINKNIEEMVIYDMLPNDNNLIMIGYVYGTVELDYKTTIER